VTALQLPRRRAGPTVALGVGLMCADGLAVGVGGQVASLESCSGPNGRVYADGIAVGIGFARIFFCQHATLVNSFLG